MKYTPYYYSKFNYYNKCPKLFEYSYIKRPDIPKSFLHLEKGNLWHKIIEYKLKNQIKFFKKPYFKEMTDLDYKKELSNIIRFMKSKKFSKYRNCNEKMIENRFSIDEKGNTVFGKQQNEIFSGKIDLINIYPHKIEVIDWKTGGKSIDKIKRFPADELQLEIYKYATKSALNTNKQIISKFCYVEHNGYEHFLEYGYKNIWQHILNKIDKIESTKIFERNESILCDYCAYKEMCFNL